MRASVPIERGRNDPGSPWKEVPVFFRGVGYIVQQRWLIIVYNHENGSKGAVRGLSTLTRLADWNRSVFFKGSFAGGWTVFSTLPLLTLKGRK